MREVQSNPHIFECILDLDFLEKNQVFNKEKTAQRGDGDGTV